MQSTAEALFADAENFPENASDGTVPQAALSVVDASTGHVCALIGGREYEVQRGLNRATQVKRQPGSVTKPLLVYAPALEGGSFTAASILKDEPTEDVYKRQSRHRAYGILHLPYVLAALCGIW